MVKVEFPLRSTNSDPPIGINSSRGSLGCQLILAYLLGLIVTTLAGAVLIGRELVVIFLMGTFIVSIPVFCVVVVVYQIFKRTIDRNIFLFVIIELVIVMIPILYMSGVPIPENRLLFVTSAASMCAASSLAFYVLRFVWNWPGDL